MSTIPPIESYRMPIKVQLPINIPNWKIDPKRAVLLIHDMQNFFVRKIPEENPRPALLENIKFLRERCKTYGIPIAYTAQPGDMTEKERGLLKDFWGSGMKAEPADREVVKDLAPDPEDWIFTKWRYSAFFRSDLLKKLRALGRDQLIICGVYAHIGILTTALEAFSHDIQTFLIADALADFSEKHHLKTLNYAAKSCAVIVLADEVFTCQ